MNFTYFFHKNGFLQLNLQGGKTKTIALNQNSGRIIWRLKDKITNIKHTGILVGKDLDTGEQMVIHNHIEHGKPELTTMTDFNKGKPFHFQKGVCNNASKEVIKIGLEKVREGKPYSILFNNCQVLTSQACNNVRKSPDVERISIVAAVGLFVGGIFAAAVNR